MYKLVFYDVENDKTRTKLAKKLEELGLIRLQYSVFIGNGNPVYWGRVQQQLLPIAQAFNNATDSCCFLVAEESEIKAMKILGNQAIAANFIIDDPDCIIL